MGTGTSQGVPAIGCKCPVCTSKDRHDKRLRCAALLENKNSDKTVTKILIDIGPEFRIQALKYKIDRLDAVLLTHGHADHIYGLDDIRIFSHTQSCGKGTEPCKNATPGKGLNFYANKNTLKDVKNRFDYIFMPTQIGGGKPKIALHNITAVTKNGPLKIGDVEILPIPMRHGKLHTSGYMFSICKNGEKICFGKSEKLFLIKGSLKGFELSIKSDDKTSFPKVTFCSDGEDFSTLIIVALFSV